MRSQDGNARRLLSVKVLDDDGNGTAPEGEQHHRGAQYIQAHGFGRRIIGTVNLSAGTNSSRRFACGKPVCVESIVWYGRGLLSGAPQLRLRDAQSQYQGPCRSGWTDIKTQETRNRHNGRVDPVTCARLWCILFFVERPDPAMVD